MPDEKRKPKLTVEQKREVLSHLAMGFGPQYIADYIFDKYNIKISHQAISSHYKHNPAFKKHIERYRNILQDKVANIPIATKVGRLKMLQKAYDEAMTWRTDKLYFDKNGGFNGKVEKRMIGIVASLVNEARVEMGGSDSKESGRTVETYFIELMKRRKVEFENGEGIRITRTEHKDLDRCMAKPAGRVF